MKKYTVLMGLCFALTGCLASGPEKPLEDMAKALENRDATAFLNHMDMKRFAANEVQGLTKNNAALSALSDMGKFLGIGGMESLLGSVMETPQQITESFTRGVSTGELINACTRSQKPNCPWVPDSLRGAKVKELSEASAVAQVTTPAGMTSWLALTKQGDAWKVVGHAVLENDAAVATKALPEPQKDSDKAKAPTPTSKAPSQAPSKAPSPAPSQDEPAPPPPSQPAPTKPPKLSDDAYAPAPPPAPVTKL